MKADLELQAVKRKGGDNRRKKLTRTESQEKEELMQWQIVHDAKK